MKEHLRNYRTIDWDLAEIASVLAENPDVRAVVTTGAKPLPEAIEEHPSLGLVALLGAGFDGIQHERLLARGIGVSYTPGASADDVADHAIALLLGLLRKLIDGDARVRAGEWTSPVMVRTPSLRGLKIGIVGMGAIGRALAARLVSFGCDLSWFGPNPKPEITHPRAASLMELATNNDVLILAHRSDASNAGLVDDQVLDALGPNSILVNVSRGSAVDEAKLIERLTSGRLGGAALDVFEQEPIPDSRWAAVPNCLLSPHVGGLSAGSLKNVALMVRENLDRFFAGKALLSPIPKR